MSRRQVIVRIVTSCLVDVEADTDDQARELVRTWLETYQAPKGLDEESLEMGNWHNTEIVSVEEISE